MRTFPIVIVALLLSSGPPAVPADPQPSLTTERIFESIQLREGGTVCEIGAGDGASTIAAAKAVGPAGRVYSNELGDTKVNKLRDAVERSGLTHITVVAAEITETNFPDGVCDALFMKDVYHHFTEPVSMNRAIMTALKPGGRAAIVDFTPPGSEARLPADRAKDGMHGITPESMVQELRAGGFEIVQSESPGQRWFMVVVARPKT